jgi:hypothetical protein
MQAGFRLPGKFVFFHQHPFPLVGYYYHSNHYFLSLQQEKDTCILASFAGMVYTISIREGLQ